MKPLQITFEGHLTKAQVQQEFNKIEAELEKTEEPQSLVVDCSKMTGYESAARTAFVDWNKRWRSKLGRVAIVTDNVLWHMVIKMMAKVSSQDMKEFVDINQAIKWAQE